MKIKRRNRLELLKAVKLPLKDTGAERDDAVHKPSLTNKQVVRFGHNSSGGAVKVCRDRGLGGILSGPGVL